MPGKQATQSLNEFVSEFIISVTEATANTLAFAKISSGIQPLEKIGWVLQKLIFETTAVPLMNGTGDAVTFGLTVSNQLTSLVNTDPAVVYKRTLQRLDFGTAASAIVYDNYWEVDFSSLQGGGLLVLPNPLYLAAQGTGLSAASTTIMRALFYPIAMSPEDYFNLVQNRQVLINS